MSSIARLVACNVYISEGRRPALIKQLQELCRAHSGVALVNTFMDEPYHRSSFTLASPDTSQLCAAAVSMAREALTAIDMQQHSASHPRLGAVDHISCHPLGTQATLQHAAKLAHCIGGELSSGQLALPVFWYGAAHANGRRLADIRRQLGYFQGSPSNRNGWAGDPQQGRQDLSHAPPDLGPKASNPRSGIITIGAVPWLVNYNVALLTGDMAAARRIARAVSERGGGLPYVEAMALPHQDCIEVACNLLDHNITSPDAVLQRIEQLAAQEGLKVGEAYRISKSPEEIEQLASDLLAGGNADHSA